ncbi:MAG: DUF4157 domain-containing protein [Pseudomonadota bacterium]
MAQRTRVRRKPKRGRAGAVRRSASSGAAAARTEAKSRSEDGAVMIGGVHDPAEKAADRMAAQALSGGSVTASSANGPASVHRKCAKCEQEEAQRAPTAGPVVASGGKSAAASPAASYAITSMGPGRPMARSERAFFEPRFGRDFSSVRVHDDAGADRAAKSIDARAFAYGDDIAFARGERERGGRALMAHELAHVAQNDDGARRTVRRAPECEPCPNPANPDWDVKIQPVVKFGDPSPSPFGSTDCNSVKMKQISVWHREKKTCGDCDVGGSKKTAWELCPRKVKVLATVDVTIDPKEITRRDKTTGQSWWTDCGGALKGADRFVTQADAARDLTDPKQKTVAGVRAHELYHVQVLQDLLLAEMQKRNDIEPLCPYSKSKIAKWKSDLETAISSAAEAFVKTCPAEGGDFDGVEEPNATDAECSKY